MLENFNRKGLRKVHLSFASKPKDEKLSYISILCFDITHA